MQKRVKKPQRVSGLKRLNPELRTQPTPINTDIDLTEFSTYESFEEEYERISSLQRKKRKEPVAYLVWFKDRPELNYISFQVETNIRIDRARDRARAEANRYLRATYPEFTSKQNYYDIYMMSRGKRIPQFDKYYKTKRVPIRELLKIGFEYSCTFCHKDKFNNSDYENGRCFIVEDEMFLNPFTTGIILCYNCYKKLTK